MTTSENTPKLRFKVGDAIAVTDPTSVWNGREGMIVAVQPSQSCFDYHVLLEDRSTFGFDEKELSEPLEAQRAELVALSYEGAHDPLNKSPYPRRKFDELPQWQKDWHERVADLVLKAGFRKEV